MPKKRTNKVNRRRVLTDPLFEMTRQNNAEFARACKANRLLRRAFALAMVNKADRYVSGRLTKTMFNILQSDAVNNRGERRVTQGVLDILEGFNFNRETSLQNVFRAPYSITINKARTKVILSFPSFMPKAMIETTTGANACMLTAIAASLDLEDDSSPADPVQTHMLEIFRHSRENLELQLPVQEYKSTHAIIIALGIEFYQEIRGQYITIDKRHNALAVIKVFPGRQDSITSLH